MGRDRPNSIRGIILSWPTLACPTTGLVVIGHGSPDPEAIVEFQAFMRLITAAHQGIIEYGYLEPLGIAEAIDRAITRIHDVAEGGASSPKALVVLPAMLMAARHVNEDIPRELKKAQRLYPNIPITFAKSLHLHSSVYDLCRTRIQQALSNGHGVPVSKTTLLVIGRGTSNVQANEEVLRLTQRLGDELGFGWAIAGYAAFSSPRISEAFDIALGFPTKEILLFPYFLFTGRLVKKVFGEANRFQEIHKDHRVVVAGHLGPDPLVRDAMMDRFYETVSPYTVKS